MNADYPSRSITSPVVPQGSKKSVCSLLARLFAHTHWLLWLMALAGVLQAAEPARDAWLKDWRTTNAVWRGVQLSVSDDRAAETLAGQLPKLATLGVNALVIEVDYNFAFDSHPELRLGRVLTKEGAAKLGKACRDQGIRPIPLFNCLGHQSWSQTTFPLLVKYPELDETPGKFEGNKDIYCRSWCPQHPEVNRIVFALLDEMIEAFGADALHAGMDEVFLIAFEHCSRCKGGDPAKLFAKAVNDLHAHLVGQRKVEMLIWGDRLLEAKTTGYGKWEASENGTHPAIDLVPKDIIVCDWHYEKRDEYRSVPLLLEKGFRVWPSGWKKVEATEALIDAAQQHRNERMLGHLCTTWGAVGIPQMAEWPPIVAAMKKWAK
ncbi:MAG: family 20 glycosylhydrolase [Verrucomicrobiota bacterium]